MLIYVIDYDRDRLEALRSTILRAAPEAEVRAWLRCADALEAVRRAAEAREPLPDAMFAEAEMPDMTGIECAKQLRRECPSCHFVLTADTDAWAARAYEQHLRGYIVRPADAARIRDELDQMSLFFGGRDSGKLQVRCFGYFEVFWKNKPLLFARKKTKELFAILVARIGSACFAEELISVLYEDTETDNVRKAKQNLRNLIFDLSETLDRIGQREILLRKGSSIAIRPDRLECDYYRMLAGGQPAAGAYSGEFMEQYSWAEDTKGLIEFSKTAQKQSKGDFLEA